MSASAPFVFILAGVIGLCLLVGFYAAWLKNAPGAMQHRKKARRAVWMRYQMERMRDQGLLSRERKIKPPKRLRFDFRVRPMPLFEPSDAQRSKIDRDALEREIRRWD